MITFQFKPEKFLNAVAFFAEGCPGGATKKKICKLLYFADKEHLLAYGRPITGDTYYRLPHGPIPTNGLDLINGKASKASLALREQFFEVDGWNVRHKRQADPKAFAKSEARTLEVVLNRFGSLSAEYLERLAHKEPTWVKTKPSQRIDFALFFEGHPEAEKLRKMAEAEADERKVLAPYRATA